MGSVIKIEVFGQRFSFKAEEDGTLAKEIADTFIKEVSKIESDYKSRSAEINNAAILILTALNSIKKNFDLEKTSKNFRSDVSTRCTKIIETFEHIA